MSSNSKGNVTPLLPVAVLPDLQMDVPRADSGEVGMVQAGGVSVLGTGGPGLLKSASVKSKKGTEKGGDTVDSDRGGKSVAAGRGDSRGDEDLDLSKSQGMMTKVVTGLKNIAQNHMERVKTQTTTMNIPDILKKKSAEEKLALERGLEKPTVFIPQLVFIRHGFSMMNNEKMRFSRRKWYELHKIFKYLYVKFSTIDPELHHKTTIQQTDKQDNRETTSSAHSIKKNRFQSMQNLINSQPQIVSQLGVSGTSKVRFVSGQGGSRYVGRKRSNMKMASRLIKTGVTRFQPANSDSSMADINSSVGSRLSASGGGLSSSSGAAGGLSSLAGQVSSSAGKPSSLQKRRQEIGADHNSLASMMSLDTVIRAIRKVLSVGAHNAPKNVFNSGGGPGTGGANASGLGTISSSANSSLTGRDAHDAGDGTVSADHGSGRWSESGGHMRGSGVAAGRPMGMSVSTAAGGTGGSKHSQQIAQSFSEPAARDSKRRASLMPNVFPSVRRRSNQVQFRNTAMEMCRDDLDAGLSKLEQANCASLMDYIHNLDHAEDNDPDNYISDGDSHGRKVGIRDDRDIGKEDKNKDRNTNPTSGEVTSVATRKVSKESQNSKLSKDCGYELLDDQGNPILYLPSKREIEERSKRTLVCVSCLSRTMHTAAVGLRNWDLTNTPIVLLSSMQETDLGNDNRSNVQPERNPFYLEGKKNTLYGHRYNPLEESLELPTDDSNMQAPEIGLKENLFSSQVLTSQGYSPAVSKASGVNSVGGGHFSTTGNSTLSDGKKNGGIVSESNTPSSVPRSGKKFIKNLDRALVSFIDHKTPGNKGLTTEQLRQQQVINAFYRKWNPTDEKGNPTDDRVVDRDGNRGMDKDGDRIFTDRNTNLGVTESKFLNKTNSFTKRKITNTGTAGGIGRTKKLPIETLQMTTMDYFAKQKAKDDDGRKKSVFNRFWKDDQKPEPTSSGGMGLLFGQNQSRAENEHSYSTQLTGGVSKRKSLLQAGLHKSFVKKPGETLVSYARWPGWLKSNYKTNNTVSLFTKEEVARMKEFLVTINGETIFNFGSPPNLEIGKNQRISEFLVNLFDVVDAQNKALEMDQRKNRSSELKGSSKNLDNNTPTGGIHPPQSGIIPPSTKAKTLSPTGVVIPTADSGAGTGVRNPGSGGAGELKGTPPCSPPSSLPKSLPFSPSVETNSNKPNSPSAGAGGNLPGQPFWGNPQDPQENPQEGIAEPAIEGDHKSLDFKNKNEFLNLVDEEGFSKSYNAFRNRHRAGSREKQCDRSASRGRNANFKENASKSAGISGFSPRQRSSKGSSSSSNSSLLPDSRSKLMAEGKHTRRLKSKKNQKKDELAQYNLRGGNNVSRDNISTVEFSEADIEEAIYSQDLGEESKQMDQVPQFSGGGGAGITGIVGMSGLKDTIEDQIFEGFLKAIEEGVELVLIFGHSSHIKKLARRFKKSPYVAWQTKNNKGRASSTGEVVGGEVVGADGTDGRDGPDDGVEESAKDADDDSDKRESQDEDSDEGETETDGSETSPTSFRGGGVAMESGSEDDSLLRSSDGDNLIRNGDSNDVRKQVLKIGKKKKNKKKNGSGVAASSSGSLLSAVFNRSGSGLMRSGSGLSRDGSALKKVQSGSNKIINKTNQVVPQGEYHGEEEEPEKRRLFRRNKKSRIPMARKKLDNCGSVLLENVMLQKSGNKVDIFYEEITQLGPGTNKHAYFDRSNA